jgi:hypothetical protein
MNTQSILSEVERQVAERLPGALFERGLILHAKRSFKYGCDCDYCKLKREATFKIGNMPVKHLVGDREDNAEFKRIARKKLRVIYRAKLKDALGQI